MAETITLGGVNYTIPDPGDQPNWGTGLTPYLVAIAANVASAPAFMQPVSVSATPTTTVSGKTYLVTTSSIAITLNLPTPATNMWLIVKDATGTAATHNITLHRPGSQTIDGTAADKVLSRNFGTWIISSDGTNYFVLNEFPDTGLLNADIAAAAGIAVSKLAALTASRAIVTDVSGFLAVAATTAAEIGFVSGVTSAIQTQLNTKIDTAGTGLSKSGTTLNLATPVAIANGGTNSGTALNSNRVMISSLGAIVEQSAIAANKVLTSDANGLPVAAAADASMNSHKITSLANGTAATDAAAFGQIFSGFQAPVFVPITGTTSNSTTSYADTTLTATITPTSSSHRIRITVSTNGFDNTGAFQTFMTLARGGTNILGANGYANNIPAGTNANPANGGFIYVDSPATTSPVTYSVQIKSSSASGTARSNPSVNTQSILLEEIV